MRFMNKTKIRASLATNNAEVLFILHERHRCPYSSLNFHALSPGKTQMKIHQRHQTGLAN